MSSELISVIVPVYKVEKYLDKCVESVFNQTYRNLEILLVDDGSPDRCGQMCDEYAAKDDRVRVIHKKNGGLSSARNAALDVLKGEYVICVDSDDYVHPDMVRKLYENAVKYDAEIVIGSHYMEKGDKLSIRDPFCDEDVVLTGKEALDKLVEDSFIKNYAWCKIYKTELFDGVRYPEGRNYEDIATTYLLFDKAKRVVKIPDFLYYYQIRDNSISYNMSTAGWHKGCHASVLGQIERTGYFKAKGYKNLYNKSLSKLVPYLYSDIRSGYIAEVQKDVDYAKKYILEHSDEILNDPMISNKDKKLVKIYLMDRPKFELCIKFKEKVLPVIAKIKHVMVKIGFEKTQSFFSLEKGKSRRIVYFELPCFDNLGDHAIAYATRDLLNKFCESMPECQLYVVGGWDTIKRVRWLKKVIGPEDIILSQGGGNFGNLYPFAQVFRRKLVEEFKNNKVIVLPETIYYTNDADGKNEMIKDQKAMSKNKNLIIFARDEVSYKNMKKFFPKTDVRKMHDMVLSLDKREKQIERKGVVLCLRSDNEGKMSKTEKNEIQSICEMTGEDVLVTDTCINQEFGWKERSRILENKWKVWSNHKVVVTDRLHGMVFSLITGTPCIVLGNNHHKVLETYKTIKDCRYIQYIDDISKFSEALGKAISIDNEEKPDYSKDYEQLKELLVK